MAFPKLTPRQKALLAFDRSMSRINRAHRLIELVKGDYARHEQNYTADERDTIRYAIREL